MSSGAARPAPSCADDALVSVVVRSTNRPSLASALNSIAAQDYAPLEVVVVAASGPDHPPLPHHSGVSMRLVSTDAPLRRAAAANVGLDAVAGAWVTFLDDDDLIEAGHVRGMMAARRSAAGAGVIHGIARTALADGSPAGSIGHPHAPTELLARNYMHLSTALLDRRAIEGCRFDESLDLLEDWDFFLDLALRTRFHFVAQRTFVWHADLGDSGAGGGRNFDPERFARTRERILAKWRPRYEPLLAELGVLLEQALAACRAGDQRTAEQRCLAALARNQNDPGALNTLAIVRRNQRDFAAARALLELANAVRPDDPRLLLNLAIVARAQGDYAHARACVQRARMADPAFAPAVRLEAQLAAQRA